MIEIPILYSWAGLLVLQPQIVLGRMELQEVGEVVATDKDAVARSGAVGQGH